MLRFFTIIDFQLFFFLKRRFHSRVGKILRAGWTNRLSYDLFKYICQVMIEAIICLIIILSFSAALKYKFFHKKRLILSKIKFWHVLRSLSVFIYCNKYKLVFLFEIFSSTSGKIKVIQHFSNKSQIIKYIPLSFYINGKSCWIHW